MAEHLLVVLLEMFSSQLVALKLVLIPINSLHLFVEVKDDRWFLDYSFSSHILHAVLMKCAYEYDITFVFPLMITCSLENAATVSPIFSLALFTESGNCFLLVLMILTTSAFLVHKVSTSFGLVYQLSR